MFIYIHIEIFWSTNSYFFSFQVLIFHITVAYRGNLRKKIYKASFLTRYNMIYIKTFVSAVEGVWQRLVTRFVLFSLGNYIFRATFDFYFLERSLVYCQKKTISTLNVYSEIYQRNWPGGPQMCVCEGLWQPEHLDCRAGSSSEVLSLFVVSSSSVPPLTIKKRLINVSNFRISIIDLKNECCSISEYYVVVLSDKF